MKFLTEHPWNFAKNVLCNQNFPSLFTAVSSSFPFKLYTETFKTLNGCTDAFQPVDNAFIFSSHLISLKQRIQERKFRGIPALMTHIEDGMCFKKLKVFYYCDMTQ